MTNVPAAGEDGGGARIALLARLAAIARTAQGAADVAQAAADQALALVAEVQGAATEDRHDDTPPPTFGGRTRQ